ncbi:hypothetical protein O181_007056 [Austropuccinia psidii MF-1]|uniref:Uncharacterized protein n=1 Tax=Austropuccinia psidii MF-1 TaxID=1389203 RepID=A0A9Q3BK55_9BASI|nr:hypothetical protein [Austropuccinia psidii MF-1]
MSTRRYSSMRICMCQHCSTQTHSSPEGDRKGVAFTPLQYKQHIKKFKSAIAPTSLPNIPTSASGSEQILHTTEQKPYSGSPNLPPQDLGMIISAILSLRYNTPRRASFILNPALNLLIKSSISSSGGPPTPAFHIPHLSTIFEHLQLDPVIQNYICCPQCFFLNDLTQYVTNDQPHFHHHNDPNDHDTPYKQSLRKFINSFEPHTQNTTNIKKDFPNKTFHLSTIQKLACQFSPADWNYGNSESTSTIPNYQRFPQM